MAFRFVRINGSVKLAESHNRFCRVMKRRELEQWLAAVNP